MTRVLRPTTRAVGPIMRILPGVLAPSVLAVAMLVPGPSFQSSTSSLNSAPKEPLELFSELMPVFTHARCMNCHGAVNPATGVGHGGGVIGQGESCTSSCHNQADNDNQEAKDDWMLSPQDRWFVGKNLRALCAQMADRVMRRGSQEFMDHLQHDLLIDLAFQGRSGGASEDPQPHPPPMPKDKFLVAAAVWLDEGFAACDRDATITHSETITSHESYQQPMDLDIKQSGKRTVTLRLANGRWSAEVEVRGQITIVQTSRAEINGAPCETIITSITDYYDSGPPSGAGGQLGNVTAPATVDVKVASDGSYTITVDVAPEKHIQAERATVRDGCRIGLQPAPSETLEQEWPETRFVIRGRFPDPRDRRRMVGAETKLVTERVGPDDDPWMYDHYAAAAQTGQLFPVTVTTSWNFRYRP